MLMQKPSGRYASSLKYDLLTALGVLALSEGKGRQRLILRLMTLITARYNWTRDELAVGQREIARLWSVDERTVKRELAKLRGLGWLVQKRAARRGRVAEYGLGIATILRDTETSWQNVGVDFDARLSMPEVPANVVPLSPRGQDVAPPAQDGSEWSVAKSILHSEDAGIYAAWFEKLSRGARAGGRLVLHAPSPFHATYVTTHLTERVLRAVRGVDPEIVEVTVQAGR